MCCLCVCARALVLRIDLRSRRLQQGHHWALRQRHGQELAPRCARGACCLLHLNRRRPAEHFVCAFCVNPLSGGNYTEKQGKPYCAECFANLFS